MPALPIAHCVRPEQSQPPSPTPPNLYAAPSCERTAATAEDEDPPADTPSAPSVCGPPTPSTSSPCTRWNWTTAPRVTGPYTPSTASPSLAWIARVVSGEGFGPL